MSDTPVMLGPCAPYATPEDLPEGCPCITITSGEEEPDETRLLELLAGASSVVWGLLGRQAIGLCEVTVHPCRANERHFWWQHHQYAVGHGSTFGLPHGCSDDAVLLEGPVNDVTEVIVDGEVLDADEYVLVNGQWLERVDGSWPSGGRPGGDNEFSITYVRGIPVDTLVRDATIEVANELWKDRCGVASCLPGPAVTAMSQAGTSYSYQGDEERVKEAGPALATMWKAIGLYNPTQAPAPSWVWSPDEPYRNRTVRTFA